MASAPAPAQAWGMDPVAMAPAARPIGALLVGIYHFVIAGALVLGGIFLMVGGSLFERFIPAGAPWKGMASAIGAFLGLAAIGFAVLAFFVGKGLLDGKKWAWVVALVFAALGALGGLGNLVSRDASSSFSFLLDVAVIVLLVIPQTRVYYWGPT